jgi:hypothetical protein
MTKFIERKDGATTFTVSGTATLLHQFDLRLIGLSLNIMAHVDRTTEIQKRMLDVRSDLRILNMMAKSRQRAPFLTTNQYYALKGRTNGNH